MSVRELLERISHVLESAGVEYMLTGSYARSLHGTPRATQDLDVVVAPTRSQLTALLKQLPGFGRRTALTYSRLEDPPVARRSG